MVAISLTANRITSHEIPETLFVDVISDVEHDAWIVVDLKGAVRMPGVYRVEEGTRLHALIERAGGLRADACVESINLAVVVHDQSMVRVPFCGENTAEENGKVSLSTASKEQLTSLPSIGPATAERIIEYRETHGPFKDIDDIVNVSGIGESTLETIRPYVVP